MRHMQGTLLRAALIGGLLLLTIGWMRQDGAGDGSDSRYVEAVLGQPLRISPIATRSTESEGDLAALIFSGLTRIGPDGLPHPDLAAMWEVTPDGLTYTFALHPNVTWHDGVAFTAHDVAFTIERIQAPDFAGPPSIAAEWADVQTFVADHLTILIRLPEPAADFLARASIGIVPAHLASRMDAPGAGLDATPFERNPVGTGPYRLTSLDQRRAVLEHNTSYVFGTPSIRRIELRFATDPDEQLAMLRRGEVDAALLQEQPIEGEDAVLAARLDLASVVLRRHAYTALYINNGATLLTQTDLRRAIAASIDREGVVASAGLVRAAPGHGVIVPGAWADQGPLPEPDVETLWESAGWDLGEGGVRERGDVPLILQLVTNADPTREAIAFAIADQLAEQGVLVDVVVEPAQRVITDYLRTGRYDMVLFGWEASFDPDPYPGWHTSQISDIGGNVAAFSDPTADALQEAARTTLDLGERREFYRLFEQRFEEQGASAIIAYPGRLYVYPERLDGLSTGLLFSPASRFRDVHLWRLDGR